MYSESRVGVVRLKLNILWREYLKRYLYVFTQTLSINLHACFEFSPHVPLHKGEQVVMLGFIF
jgi:hypothetical protein